MLARASSPIVRSARRGAAWAGLALWLAAGLAAAADYPGFRLAEPSGEDWQPVQRNAGSVVWMRRLPDPSGSFAAAVLTGPAPTRFEDTEGFVAYVRRVKSLNPQPARYAHLLEHFEPVAEPGPRCVRYRTAITERPGDGRPPLVLRVTGLACLHPERPDRYFDVQYSMRAPRGVEPPAAIAAEGEAFLAGFEFGPPPPDDRWALGSRAVTRPDREKT
jgi:hypothetical protein